MLTTPPKLIIFQLKNGHILTDIKILNSLIFKSLTDHRMRIIYHLMQLDANFILYTNLSSMVGTPSIKLTVCHQSDGESSAWFYLFDCYFLFLFKILEVTDWLGDITVFGTCVAGYAVLSTAPVIDSSFIINGEIEQTSCCDSFDFHIFKEFNSFRLEYGLLTSMT